MAVKDSIFSSKSEARGYRAIKRCWVWVAMLACALLATGLVGCQLEFTEKDADRFVEALMTNERYQAYLADEDGEMVKAMTEAMMEHPSMQTTRGEDCVTVILMAAVMSGDYAVPPDSDVDRLCDWYLGQIE